VWIDARSNVHPIHSVADGLEGFIELDLDQEGQVTRGVKPLGELTMPVARLSSGNRLEDRELYKRIDARRFPAIRGVLDEMEQSGESGEYRVAGDVAFRGVMRRCEDHMTLQMLDDRTIQLAGASTFDIRDFGMEPPRVLMLKVEPEVAVRVEIVAEREG
jgi:polyisoprenoid-binding protein YceI